MHELLLVTRQQHVTLFGLPARMRAAPCSLSLLRCIEELARNEGEFGDIRALRRVLGIPTRNLNERVLANIGSRSQAAALARLGN